MLGILSAVRVALAIKRQKLAEAEQLATRWSKRNSSSWRAYLTWYSVCLLMGSPRDQRIAILRKGHDRFPFATQIVDALFHELLIAYDITSDSSNLDEAARVLTTTQDVLGPELTDLREADLAIARGELDKGRTLAAAASSRMVGDPRLTFDVATTLLQVPSSEEEGIAMLRSLLNNRTAGSSAALVLAAVHDEWTSERERYLDAARRKWSGTDTGLNMLLADYKTHFRYRRQVTPSATENPTTPGRSVADHTEPDP